MHKNISSIVALLLLSQLSGQASVQSDKAFRELDCQFKDCRKPKVIEKEKIVYVDKPVIQEKIVYVDKPIVEEKIVVQEKIVEKIVYKDKEPEVVVPVKKQTNANVQYNRANIDCTVNGHSVINDYIEYDSVGFDFTKFRPKLVNSGEAHVFCSISGYIEMPNDSATSKINLLVDKPYAYLWTRGGGYQYGQAVIINDFFSLNGKNPDTKVMSKAGMKYIKYQLKVGEKDWDGNWHKDGWIASNQFDKFLTASTTMPLINTVKYAQKRGEEDVVISLDASKIFLFKE